MQLSYNGAMHSMSYQMGNPSVRDELPLPELLVSEIP